MALSPWWHSLNKEEHSLSGKYFAALERRLKAGARQPDGLVAKFGAEAVALGLDTLDLARIHEGSLDALTPPNCSPTELVTIRRRSNQFFFEALGPISANTRQLKAEIVQRKKAEAALRKSEQHHVELLKQSRAMEQRLRLLSHKLISAQEDERKKISRELHDQIAQMLAGVNVHLATLKGASSLSSVDLNSKIRRSQKMVERSVQKVHRFARELRPPVLDDLGLIPALHSELKHFTERTGIQVRFTAAAAVEELHIDRRTALFRVAQSALTNVGQHAHATKVTLTLTKVQDAVEMHLHDDGKSFDVEKALFVRKNGRLGLIGMRERIEMVGGRFSVVSTPGEGTTIGLQIPLRNMRRKTLS